ncbi:hypothetical protein GW17_00047468 [Ensete ventricosum]|nr:hypothetical protein GW17_00047468 [Ensete ventricosum]
MPRSKVATTVDEQVGRPEDEADPHGDNLLPAAPEEDEDDLQELEVSNSSSSEISHTGMAVAMVQFLMEKFVDALEEDDSSAFPFHALFQGIKEDLKVTMRSPVPLGTADLLRDSLYDLNDILIECRTLSKKHTGLKQRKLVRLSSMSSLWFLYKAKKRLQAIKHSIQPRNHGGVDQNYSSGSLSGDMEFDRWTSRSVDKSKVYGLDDQLNAIERMLSEEDSGGFKGIGVVGMGGVGKTVLAQMVFNSPQVRRRFFPRLWVCMSQTVKRGRDVRREMLERTLMALGVEEEAITSISEAGGLAELMFALHLQLMNKRYLIVFDDVWNIDEWYEGLMSSGLPDEGEWAAGHLPLDRVLPKGCGGSVIVTSRLKEVAVKMVGEENVCRI